MYHRAGLLADRIIDRGQRVRVGKRPFEKAPDLRLDLQQTLHELP
jgi:hypothetical protein